MKRNGEVVAPPYDADSTTALAMGFDMVPAWIVAMMPRYPEMEDVFIPGDEIMVVFDGLEDEADGIPRAHVYRFSELPAASASCSLRAQRGNVARFAAMLKFDHRRCSTSLIPLR